jgi:hypothetical protein
MLLDHHIVCIPQNESRFLINDNTITLYCCYPLKTCSRVPNIRPLVIRHSILLDVQCWLEATATDILLFRHSYDLASNKRKEAQKQIPFTIFSSSFSSILHIIQHFWSSGHPSVPFMLNNCDSTVTAELKI